MTSPEYFLELIDEFMIQDEHLERKETNTPNIELQESPTKPNTNESKQICSSPIIITTTQYEDDQDNTSNTICTIESSDKEQNSGVETEAKKLLNENQTIITASNEVQIVEVSKRHDTNTISIFRVNYGFLIFFSQDYRQ